MDKDIRHQLLLNRTEVFNTHPDKETMEFQTHIHMSWPAFYKAIVELPESDASILIFNEITAFMDDGILLDAAQMPLFNKLSDMEVTNGPNTIH
ncbi:hypothetical protein LCGC14_2687740 [marine sediment metagenome]|uniref:Uncharacterized protein n=1 Tax=marine sediment metagenome TaxID=412755 RepID=A0A0F9A6Y7_9ZZZZ